MTNYLTMFRLSCFVILLCLCSGRNANAQGFVVNGSFETGDFTNWVVTDNQTPFEPFMVLPSGSQTAFSNFATGPHSVIPSDGMFAANNGFDGDAGTISIAQDIGTIAFGDVLNFDYRAAWDLMNFSTPTDSDRTFDILLEPAGGGPTIVPISLLTAMIGTDTFGGTNSDTGPLSAALNLTFFTGLSLRINFVWTIPDNFSGPANAQLDNVEFTNLLVPEPSSTTVCLLGLVGMIARRRR